MEKYGLGYRSVDLHSVAFFHYLINGKKIPQKSDGRSGLNLTAILDYVGLPPEEKPHNGLNGAKLEAEAFSRLIKGKVLLKEYAKHPVPEHLLK